MKRRQFIETVSKAGILSAVAPGIPGNIHFPSSIEEPHFCIFSKHLQWLDYHEMAVLAKELGFTGIDLTVRPSGHVEPEKAERDLPRAVEAVRAVGLEVPMITTNILDPDDQLSEKVLSTAGKLGIKTYRTGWWRYGQGTAVKEVLKTGNEKLRRLQDLNATYNIRGGYQNHAGSYAGSSLWDLMILLDGIDPRWMGVQFDIRHAIVEGPDSWPFALEQLAPWVNSLDIKDFTWQQEEDGVKLINVPLGKGIVNFDLYFNEIRRLGIEADYSLHLEYPLGGADHGNREISITPEDFKKQVLLDIDFFKEYTDI